MANFIFYLGICMLLMSESYQPVNGYVARIIKELLQNGLAGAPVIHSETKWNFDPEISEKRRNLFYQQHGYRAAKFIESIGVGIDGNDEERRLIQARRDQGRLNGEHNINFP